MTQVIALTGLLFLAPAAGAAEPARPPSAPGQRIESPMIDASGKRVGTAAFVSSTEGVDVTVDVRGLAPGLHGLHVHENGLCDAEKGFSSAGGHFAPDGKGHGLLSGKGPHAGDLPNLRVQADGTARLKAKLRATSLNPAEPDSLLHPAGTALIVHAGPDDQATSPSGKSGGRVACAVISSARSR